MQAGGNRRKERGGDYEKINKYVSEEERELVVRSGEMQQLTQFGVQQNCIRFSVGAITESRT